MTSFTTAIRATAKFTIKNGTDLFAKIDKIKDGDGLPPPEQFGLIDDLGVGLDSTGESAEAVRWLRLKLKAGKPWPPGQAALHQLRQPWYVHRARQYGQGTGRKQRRTGASPRRPGLSSQEHRGESRSAIGGEIWQAIIAEFLLAVSVDRNLLLKYDMVGNSLALNSFPPWRSMAHDGKKPSDLGRRVAAHLQDSNDPEEAAALRSQISRVGKESGDFPTSLNGPVPFDEPCLGIIGMWRLGGGANPHFALRLARPWARQPTPSGLGGISTCDPRGVSFFR